MHVIELPTKDLRVLVTALVGTARLGKQIVSVSEQRSRPIPAHICRLCRTNDIDGVWHVNSRVFTGFPPEPTHEWEWRYENLCTWCSVTRVPTRECAGFDCVRGVRQAIACSRVGGTLGTATPLWRVELLLNLEDPNT